jgi:hypothetical protein
MNELTLSVVPMIQRTSSAPKLHGIVEEASREALFLTLRAAPHCSVMSDTAIEEKLVNPKADEWSEQIAAQQRSGISVKRFCKEQGVSEYSFYTWHKWLHKSRPVRFALIERSARRQERTAESALEVVLASGERLRIGPGVETATLRAVLDGCGDDAPASRRASVPVPGAVRHKKEFRQSACTRARAPRFGSKWVSP